MLYSTSYRLSIRSVKRFTLGASVVALSILTGCEPEPNPKGTLAEVKSAFQQSILQLETEQKHVKGEFKEGRSTLIAFQTALKNAVDKDKEFAKVYNRWREIQGRISVLYDRFLGLVDGADRVYSELDNRANRISNQEYRNQVKSEIEASIKRYASRLRLSKKGIDRLRRQATQVTDVMSALEVRFTLKVVEDELGSIFKDIDDTVEAVMAQLESLIEESKQFPAASPLVGNTN